MGYVYVLQSGDTDRFKIGRTENDVESRIKQLSTGNPFPLKVFDVIQTDYASKCETFLHNRLQPKRSRESDAKEFFRIDPDEMRAEIQMARVYVENDLPRAAQVEQLACVDCEDRWVSPTDTETELFSELLEIRASLEMLTHRRERLENELKLVIGTALGLEGLATWKVVEGHRFDTERFANEEPELYTKYYFPTRQRTFRLL